MFIRDQIHGDIEFSAAEMQLINSKSFQRMRYIKQLGFVDNIYPSAVHNRFQHSLGACKCITDMYNAIVKANPEFYQEGDLELLRLIALVHDMGHSPFSHASEELSDMTHEARLYDILQLESKNITIPNNYNVPTWKLVYEIYMGEGLTYMSNPHLMTLHTFMDNFIDADKLDYLQRDAVNCGVTYGRFDYEALIRNLVLITDKTGIQRIGIMDAGVQALEGFILARYYMFSQVYMHPEERITRQLFIQEMKSLLPNGKYPDDVKKFMQLDDTKYSRKLNCLYNLGYELVLDMEFNAETKLLLDRKLDGIAIADVAHKAIFRKDKEDNTIYVKSTLNSKIIACADASPILKKIEFTYVHRLRYYARPSDAANAKDIINKLIERNLI